MQKTNAKPNKIFCMAVILLILSLLTVCLMPNGLYARYRTSTAGTDGARVAKFKVSSALTGTNSTAYINISMQPNVTSDSYLIVVENDSEVAVKCTVTVLNETQNLPLQFKLVKRGDSESGSFTPITSSVSQDYTVADNGGIYELTVVWPEDAKDFQYQGKPDSLLISVRCEQID